MTRPGRGLKFGAFISPIHSNKVNPTLALQRDVELVELLERLGFDEAWVGEHHSTGWEYIASPEVFLAYAAARTHRIRLGAGVVSLPYHHPLNVADRFVLLDHLSRGRAVLGVGPGALPYDAEAIGIDTVETRPRMEQSLDAIMALLKGDRVSINTNWFQLDRAALQLMPYQPGGLEIAVAATISPNGPRLAGRLGASLLSMNATQRAGFNVLAEHWSIMEEQSQRYGTTVDRGAWRMVGPMYLAETEEQALKDVEKGLDEWCYYAGTVSTLPILPPSGKVDGSWAKTLVDTGFAVIGTPEQAIAQLERLQEQTGGFGTYLIWANDWASVENTRRSYELFASEVMPHFSPGSQSLIEAEEWAVLRRPDLTPSVLAAREKARMQFEIERAASPTPGSATG
ncbi:LLM class flavin-dependent oxidoreductase [Micromonospora radicis]|uniref:LLM class flavin-dependent oxidoreductase n=1 Tax=Micromonospora radicis TaxID=1894971 RepID=A0A418MX33_9ACTN|nr:LLM class flavin-dependent oxidoreductase [Micromonospora radicis]RIV39227.1 LLM class flavin-dependent oxidoreductase [Micromonospora radicis]